MNPDMNSPEYVRMVARQKDQRLREQLWRDELHAKAVARRKKRKRGGKK